MNYEYRASYWLQVIIVEYENCVFVYRCIVHDWSFLNAYIFEKKRKLRNTFQNTGHQNSRLLVEHFFV